MSKLNSKFIWDYDLAAIKSNQPASVKWLLERQLMFGDLTGIKKKQLTKYLPDLQIDLSLKELLANYLYLSHAKKN